jgi:hypothetical protein
MEFIKQLLDPLAMLWLFLVLATLWLTIRRRWQMALATAVVVLTVTLLGNTRLMAGLLAGLERPYRQPNLAQLPPADVILMLGGSLRPSADNTMGTELEFVIMVIAVSCVKLLSAHNSTQHTSRKHKV